MKFTLEDLARKVKGRILGPPDTVVEGIDAVENARTGSLVYVENPKGIPKGEISPAAALLVPSSVQNCSKPAIVVENPKLAFARLLPFFFPEQRFAPGIHPTAVVHETATIGNGTHMGPHVVVEKNAVIGERVVLSAFVFVGEGAWVGDDTYLHPRATILKGVRIGKRCIIHEGGVIGGEGFGYATGERGEAVHVPQVGTVVIGDDVEIGVNSAIDRATLGETRIGNGTKIDNLVHVAHNCTIGENCLIAAMVGIAGSVEIGSGTIIGGQAGFKDHLCIGEKCVIAAGCKVWGDLPPGSFVSGEPARPHKENLKILGALSRLPDIARHLQRLQQEKNHKKTNR